MLYVKYNANGDVVGACDAGRCPSNEYDTVRHTTNSMAEAEKVAEQVSLLLGDAYIPIDNGAGSWPRFDAVKAPQVGDEVSYYFNGDSYPCGVITKISKSLKRIETSEGKVFYRKKLRASWLNNRTWSLVAGHRSERNPHF